MFCTINDVMLVVLLETSQGYKPQIQVGYVVLEFFLAYASYTTGVKSKILCVRHMVPLRNGDIIDGMRRRVRVVDRGKCCSLFVGITPNLVFDQSEWC